MEHLTYLYIVGAFITIIFLVYYFLAWRKSGVNSTYDIVIVRLKPRFFAIIFLLSSIFLGFIISAIINEIWYNGRFYYSTVLFYLWFEVKSITWKYTFNNVGIISGSGYRIAWDYVSYWEFLSFKPDYIFIEFKNGKDNLQFKVSENKDLLTKLLTRNKGVFSTGKIQ